MQNIMTKVIFKFDKEKDLWNNWFAVNFESKWELGKNFNNIQKLEEGCKGKTFEECKKKIEDFHKRLHNSFLIEETKNAFQEAWNKINEEFFKRLEKITGNKFPFKEVTAYITTQSLCPYDYKGGSFMISIFSNIPSALKMAGHELMHLDFHNNDWKKIEEKIGKEKTSDLKEALTILLNLEFRDLWFVEDKGKSSEEQQKLREFIKKGWSKEKNYKSLLQKCIIYLKK